MTKTQPIVLAGPTAVGKGTVIAVLAKYYPTFNVSVSVIARDPRPGELNGVHYHFVSTQELDAVTERGDTLEWVLAYGSNKCGMPRGPADEVLVAGKSAPLGINLADARQIRTDGPDAQFVFSVLPSWEELGHHIIGRSTKGPEEQTRRLATARIELEAASESDRVAVNDDVRHAVDELTRLIGLEQHLSEPATEENTRVSGVVAQSVGTTSLSVDDLLEHVSSKYAPVIFTTKRARQINSYNLQFQQNMIQFVGPVIDVQPDEKPLVVSLRKINEGLLSLEANPGA